MKTWYIIKQKMKIEQLKMSETFGCLEMYCCIVGVFFIITCIYGGVGTIKFNHWVKFDRYKINPLDLEAIQA